MLFRMCHNSVNSQFCYCEDFISSAASFKSILVTAFHACCGQSNSYVGKYNTICQQIVTMSQADAEKKKYFTHTQFFVSNFYTESIHDICLATSILEDDDDDS